MKIEFAKSLSGHDKNQYYLILEKKGRFAYLADGKTHTMESPKKKNEKHYQIVKNIPKNILEQFKENESLTDDMIYRAVRAYERSVNKQ